MIEVEYTSMFEELIIQCQIEEPEKRTILRFRKSVNIANLTNSRLNNMLDEVKTLA